MMRKELPRSVGKEMPFALTYNATLQQADVVRPTEQLYFQNPYRGPAWVDEFHFTIQSNDYVLPLGFIAMRMKINNEYIVDEFVPLTLLAPHTDVIEVYGTGGHSFFWRLAKPMWLNELDDVLIELSWPFVDISTTVPLTSPAVVSVTMCGRATLNKYKPKERFLPFNVAWGPLAFHGQSLGTEFSEISPDDALRNGKNKPVTVTRMLAFCNETKSAGAAGIIPSSNMLMNLRLSHSSGYYIIKDLTPFYELFQNVSRSFSLKCILQPKEFVTLELLTKTIVLLNYPEVTVPFTYYMGFSLQGYSVEALS